MGTLLTLKPASRMNSVQLQERREALRRRRYERLGVVFPTPFPQPIPLPAASPRAMLAIGRVLIGYEGSRPVYLDNAVRDQGLYMPGKNGMGKSTLLKLLMLAD